jgi:hypothetical protein
MKAQRLQGHNPAMANGSARGGYCGKSLSELERIENVNIQIGDVGGVACHTDITSVSAR